MKKAQKFTLTLSIALAAALIFSCSSDSSDDDDVGNGGLSDLYTKPNQQVYNIDGKAFNGSGDVVLVFTKWDDNYENILWRDELPAGKIENGKLTLDLPKSLDSKYLKSSGDDFCEDAKSSCVNELKNTMQADGMLYITISEVICRIRLEGSYSEDGISYNENAGLFYTQEAGRMKADFDYGWDGHPDDYTYDYNFSKGWNTYYSHYEDGDGYSKSMKSTDPSIIEGELKWQLYCQGGNDNDNNDNDHNNNTYYGKCKIPINDMDICLGDVWFSEHECEEYSGVFYEGTECPATGSKRCTDSWGDEFFIYGSDDCEKAENYMYN